MPGGPFGCCLPRKGRSGGDGDEDADAHSSGGAADSRPEEQHARFLAMLEAMEQPVIPSIDDPALILRPGFPRIRIAPEGVAPGQPHRDSGSQQQLDSSLGEGADPADAHGKEYQIDGAGAGPHPPSERETKGDLEEQPQHR